MECEITIALKRMFPIIVLAFKRFVMSSTYYIVYIKD